MAEKWFSCFRQHGWWWQPAKNTLARINQPCNCHSLISPSVAIQLMTVSHLPAACPYNPRCHALFLVDGHFDACLASRAVLASGRSTFSQSSASFSALPCAESRQSKRYSPLFHKETMHLRKYGSKGVDMTSLLQSWLIRSLISHLVYDLHTSKFSPVSTSAIFTRASTRASTDVLARVYFYAR